MKAEDVTELLTGIIKGISIIGYWRFLLGALVIYICFIGWKFIHRYMTRKDREESVNLEKQKIDIQKENIKLNYTFIDITTKFMENQTSLIERIESSTSVFNHSKLTRRFLGLDRDFSDVLKSKLLSYSENKINDSYYNIKEELKDMFHNRVLSELTHFTFSDITLSESTLSKCNDLLDSFFTEFEVLLISDGEDAIKDFMKEQNRVQELLLELAHTIEDEYQDKLINDKKLSFLKREM